MKCKLCGKDTASVKYDRVQDRWFVDCSECNCYVLFNHLRTKEEVTKAYEESIPDKKKAKK